ncbi:MAG: phosphatidate cytidylyltransferase [Chloroflexota bacterium]|nr:phosphatidate cytidylyltransferase [Chloroflexota bacterium]
MHSQRVKAALLFVPLVLIMIVIGGWVHNLFFIAVLLVAAFEYARLFRKLQTNPSVPVMMGGVALIALGRWLLPTWFGGLLIALVIFAAAVAALVQYERGDDSAAFNFAVTLSGVIYIGWVGSYLIDLRALPAGRGWMLTTLPAVWLADSGAYYFGSWLGKAKMSPRLSPNKSWAGLIGAIVTGTLGGALLVLLWRRVGWLPAESALWHGAVIGLAVGVLSPVGDLLISLFKRTAEVKDTGNLIPGHGGILDRIDTWIWAALLGYYLVMLYGMG